MGAVQTTTPSQCGGVDTFPCGNAFVVKFSPASYANLSGNSLDFGNEVVQTTSPTQSVTLTVLGDAAFTLNSITASGDFALVTTGTACLYGGGALAFQTQCTIDVSFTPTATGIRTGNVQISDNAPGNPQTIALTGTGLAFVPTLTPASLGFGDQLIGTASAPQTVTFTNPSSDVINFVRLTLTGNWTETNTCLPSVGPRSSCTFAVEFAPTEAGVRKGGALVIYDDAPGEPETVPVTGVGIASAPTLSPGSLSFGSQLIGTTTVAPKYVQFTNTSTVAVPITNVAISSGWTQTNTCLPSVGPGASCVVTINFAPTSTGPLTGALTITDYAANSPQTVRLSGTGFNVTATLSAGALRFAGEQVGTTSAPQTVTVQNSGNQTLAIASIALGGANSGDFAMNQTCGTSLAAGATSRLA